MVNENKEPAQCDTSRNTRKCKHFHQDPYWTPNNYDLSFDYNAIPVNIEVESNPELIKRLRKHMPLSKILHINMDSEGVQHNDGVELHTRTKVSFKRKNSNNIIEEVVVNLR